MSYIKTAAERELPSTEVNYRSREETRITLKHVLKPFAAWLKAFSTPYTVPKSETMRPGSEIYRGWHTNNVDLCTGCGSCEAVCMNEAIDLVLAAETSMKDTGLRPRIDYGRCCWCGLCVDVCALGSLSLSPEYLWVGADPEEFRFTPGIEAKPWDDSQGGWRKQKKQKPAAKAA